MDDLAHQWADIARAYETAGAVPRFLSRLIAKPWNRPIPGPSLIRATARRQMRNGTYPEDTGTLYNPTRDRVAMDVADVSLNAKPAEDLQLAEEVERRALIGQIADIDNSREYALEMMELGREAMGQLRKNIQGGDQEAAAMVAGTKPKEESASQAAQEPAQEPAQETQTPEPIDAATQTPDEIEEAPEQADSGRGTADSGPSQASGRSNKSKPKKPRVMSAAPLPSMPRDKAVRSGTGDARPDVQGPGGPCYKPGSSHNLKEKLDFARSLLDGDESQPRCSKVAKLGNRDLMYLMRCGATGASMLTKFTAERMKVVRELMVATRKSNRKLEFFGDRAHAIVRGAMLELDHAFLDVGFGGWMPFRFPDQYLIFTSVMRKILAANGLICPKGPNHWMKFIKETPEVPREKEFPQAPIEMLPSWCVSKKDKEIKTFEELKQVAEGIPYWKHWEP